MLANELNRRSELKVTLTLEQIQGLMTDLLTAIDILHGKMIMHRDIKPDNILIDSAGRLKLADFGLAKKASFLQRRKSNAIVSLWYRAPEIILGSEDYFLGVDMWSIGCIFAEMYSKRPVFMCKSEDEVLAKVFYMLGTPCETHCPMYLKLPKFDRKKWRSGTQTNHMAFMFPDAPSQALDLMGKLLNLDPNKRLLAKQALSHPFFSATKINKL